MPKVQTKAQASPARATPEAPAVHTASKAKYVTVASKLPMSIIIQLCTPKNVRVTGQFGSTTETVHTPTGRAYTIRGTGYPNGQPPKGFPKRPDMIEDEGGGYALTPNIPADFFAEWLQQNAETEMVVNGIIKAQATLEDLAADAAEHAKQDSGLGPLNPDGDRRQPQPMNTQLSGVQADTGATASR